MIAIVVRDLLLLWSFLGSTNAQCDTYFPDQQISYISSNPSSPSVYYLSNSLSSAASCKAACEDLNFMCDASQKHTFDHVEGSFSTDPDLCRLTLNDPGNDYGSAMILTPDIAAAEYTIEMNFRITSGEEGGLVFGASNSKFPNVYVVVSPLKNRMHIGKLHSSGAQYTVWQDVNTKTISHNVDYTIKIEKLSSGHWRAYLDNVLTFSSSSTAHKVTASAFPESRVGAYTWNANMRYNWLKVSFPSSQPETVCSGYVFNSATSQCSGYYGTDYAALYQSLSSNTGFDSGVMSPTCPTPAPTTNAPTTKAPTTKEPTTKQPTWAPTTKEPTTETPTSAAPTTKTPTTNVPTTKAPTTKAPTTKAPTTKAPTTKAPTTKAPTTKAPTTKAPTTKAPTTKAPTTNVPTTTTPTKSPTTETPTTKRPTPEGLWVTASDGSENETSPTPADDQDEDDDDDEDNQDLSVDDGNQFAFLNGINTMTLLIVTMALGLCVVCAIFALVCWKCCGACGGGGKKRKGFDKMQDENAAAARHYQGNQDPVNHVHVPAAVLIKNNIGGKLSGFVTLGVATHVVPYMQDSIDDIENQDQLCKVALDKELPESLPRDEDNEGVERTLMTEHMEGFPRATLTGGYTKHLPALAPAIVPRRPPPPPSNPYHQQAGGNSIDIDRMVSSTSSTSTNGDNEDMYRQQSYQVQIVHNTPRRPPPPNPYQLQQLSQQSERKSIDVNRMVSLSSSSSSDHDSMYSDYNTTRG